MSRFSLNEKDTKTTKESITVKRQRINNTFHKIKSTILSCDHLKQLPTARRMIGIYKYQADLNFNFITETKELAACFRDYNTLCKILKEKETQLKKL